MAPTTPSALLFLISQDCEVARTILLTVSSNIEFLSATGEILPTNWIISIELLWPRSRWKPMAAETRESARALLLLFCKYRVSLECVPIA